MIRYLLILVHSTAYINVCIYFIRDSALVLDPFRDRFDAFLDSILVLDTFRDAFLDSILVLDPFRDRFDFGLSVVIVVFDFFDLVVVFDFALFVSSRDRSDLVLLVSSRDRLWLRDAMLVLDPCRDRFDLVRFVSSLNDPSLGFLEFFFKFILVTILVARGPVSVMTVGRVTNTSGISSSTSE